PAEPRASRTGYWQLVSCLGNSQSKIHRSFASLRMTTLEVLLRFFLGSEAGFYGRTDARQQVFGILGVAACRSQFKILLESCSCTLWRNRLAVLSDGHLGEQVQALLVVRFGFGGIGGNHLIPYRNRLVRLARVGQDCAGVEQIRSGMRRIQSGSLIIVGDGIIDLARLGINLGKVVIVGSQLLVIVSLFLSGFRSGAQVDGLLVIGGGHFETLLLFVGIGLLGRRHAVGVGQLEPDEIAGAVDLVGFRQGGDGGFVIAGTGSCVSGVQLFVKRAHRLLFSCGFGVGFVHLRGLFWSHPLPGCGGVLFLQVEVLRGFVHADGDALEVEELLAVFVQSDVVAPGIDAEREIFALVIGLEAVLVAGVGRNPLHYGAGDWLAVVVFANSLHTARDLREREWSDE